jgi:hypothetical protein
MMEVYVLNLAGLEAGQHGFYIGVFASLARAQNVAEQWARSYQGLDEGAPLLLDWRVRDKGKLMFWSCEAVLMAAGANAQELTQLTFSIDCREVDE